MFGKQYPKNNITRKHTAKAVFQQVGLVVLAFAYAVTMGLMAGQARTADAAIPKYINFQGKLTAVSNGNNVANGTYTFQFKLYDSLSGGSLLWTETYDQAPTDPCQELQVTNGVFNAKLGSCNPLTGVDFTGGSLYLTINFDPGTGYDGEMAPRKQLVSSAYAFVANSVSGDGVINTANQSATALTVGRGATYPALQVDTNTASSETGLKVTSAAAAGGLALGVISSGTNENLTIDAKGSGAIALGTTSSGDVMFGGGYGSSGVSISSAGNIQANGTLTVDGSIATTGAITGATGFNGLVVTANTGAITNGSWNATAVGSQYGGTGQNFSASTGVPSISSGTWSVNAQLPVNLGGTGAATFTTNGVLYGNSTSAIQVTAQGAADTVLVANAGAPSFSAAITVGTSVTSPTINATSSLQLGGTSINTAGTLTNVAYENQVNTFTANNIFQPTVTTGTGATAGVQIAANSLTTGNGLDVSSTSVTTGSVVNLSSTSTAAGSNTQKVLNVATSGANGTSTQTTYGGYFSNTHTGTSSTNIAGYFTASGGTSNYAAIFDAGNVGIGTTTPSAKLNIVGSSATGDMVVTNTGSSSSISVASLLAASATGDTYFSVGRALTSGNSALIGHSTTGGGNYAFLTTYGRPAADFVVNATGNVGIGTIGPNRSLEINNATGQNLRLTYNDADGTATNYADLLTTSAGALTIQPSGFIANIGGGATQTALRFLETSGNGTDYAAFQAPASVTTAYTWTLPAADASGCIQSNGSGTLSIAACGGSSSWSALTAPSGNLSLAHGSNTTAFTFNSVTTGTAFDLSSSSLSSGTVLNLASTSTAAASNTQKVLNVTTSGANGTSTQTTYAAQFANTHTGTSSTNYGSHFTASGGTNNIAGYFTASGGTNNYAAIFDAGQVGIGVTSSLTGKLHVVGSVTASGATAVAGTFSDLSMSNNTASGYQYGNRTIATISAGGQAGTHVGEFIRMIDNTTYNAGQDVRGLEVQAFSGTNYDGTNTGIASYGYTFGIQATTTAQAAAQAAPAAVFADLNNGTDATTKARGNAIRAYTNDATSADMVYIYQETSAYTGNALLMDIGNGAGSFASGNFINLKKAGTTKFNVASTGVTGVNFNSAPTTYGVCHSGADINGATDTVRDLVACNGGPSDLAEWYETMPGVEAGDVVSVTNETFTYQETQVDPMTGAVLPNKITRSNAKLNKSQRPNDHNIIGVVSTSPFQVMGADVKEQGANPRPIALSGRVPVKVNAENGAIKPGDFLTTSSTPGVAMKATKAGAVVGQALEGFNGTSGKIIVFIKATNFDGVAIEEAIDGLAFDYSGFGTMTDGSDFEIASQRSVQILNYLITQLPNLDTDNLSQVRSDVVIAGAEVIAPTMTTGILRTNTLASATADGGLVVSSAVMFNGGLMVDSIKSIGDILAFDSDVEFFGTPYFTADTAGFAVIRAGAQTVDVVFGREYLAQPIVNASFSFEQGEELDGNEDEDTMAAFRAAQVSAAQNFLNESVNYAITNKSKFGFTIVLNKPATTDVKFSWTALAVKNPNVFMSMESEATEPAAGSDSGDVAGDATGGLSENSTGSEQTTGQAGEQVVDGSTVAPEETAPPSAEPDPTDDQNVTQ